MTRQVFPFLLARNCRMLPSNSSNVPKPAKPSLGFPNYGLCSLETLQTFRNLPNCLLELPNYGLWQATSVLFYWPETAGCSLQTLTKPSKPALGAASCATPSLSFSTGPKLPDVPLTWRAGGGYKYIARLEHLYNLLTKWCNLPYKWCEVTI